MGIAIIRISGMHTLLWYAKGRKRNIEFFEKPRICKLLLPLCVNLKVEFVGMIMIVCTQSREEIPSLHTSFLYFMNPD